MVRITVQKPDQDEEVVAFDAPAELTIGRSGECAYCLDFDPRVSRMHAVLMIDPPSVRIKDLNSTNGIVINGEVYGAVNNQRMIQPLELRDGDEVYVGLTRFTVGAIDTELDLGPELTKIKAEQEAADAELMRKQDAMETMADSRFASRFAPAGIMGGRRVSRGGGNSDTVADLSAVCPDIPGYQMDRFIAAGRTGSIYKARAEGTGRAVVLKVATPGGVLSRKLAEDFRRDLEGLRALPHRGMAELLDFGDIGHSTFYTVSEFVNGESLASYLGRCPGNKLPLSASFSLLKQMAEAVCHLHGNNIVRRDIHPGGVMLFDDKGKLRAKLTDGGLSRFWAESGLETRGGALPGEIGRLAYTAPEEATPQGAETKPSSDVFSLGCVFYQMLTGRVPYEFGDEASPLHVVEEGRMRPIEELASGLPETVVVIAERALAPDPELRYQTACELLEALEDIAGNL